MNLIEQCEKVLEKNWRGKFTIPSPRLYPFQWNWDSGLIAIGNLYYKPERSLIEMETLFAGQWDNGFLPHILFHDAEKHTSYFPSADYWDSSVSPHSSSFVRSSGITQPPLHGFILEYLVNHGFEKERLSKLFDQILKYHDYLYKDRQHEDTGLVAIWHNWESGMDNSVYWDETLDRLDKSEVNRIEVKRKDTQQVKSSEETRPKDLDYKRYIYLLHLLRNNRYEKVNEDYPFQILDPLFNSLLIKSNKSLIKIGKEFNRDTKTIQSQLEKSINSFQKFFWNENDNLYYPYDLILKKQIKKHCSGSYTPIYAGIPSDGQVKNLLKHLEDFPDVNLIPSTFPDQQGFEEKKYWRGPVWVNMNWLVWKGLLDYGFTELAEKIKETTVQLVDQFGVYEYFYPFKNYDSAAGLGGEDFAWSAALIIDMLRSK